MMVCCVEKTAEVEEGFRHEHVCFPGFLELQQPESQPS